MEKQIIVVSGDKGGVGKSTAANLVIDYCLAHEQKVTLVEGDVNIADVAWRYQGVDGVTVLGLDLDKSGIDAQDAVNKLFTEIEQEGGDVVVVNTPANVSKTLDAEAALIAEAAEALGYELRVIWMLGTGEEGARLSASSAICAVANRKIAVVNKGVSGYVDDSQYAWFSEDGKAAREAWQASGGLEGTLAALTPRIAEFVRTMPGSYMSLTKPEAPLNVISRSGLWRWVQASWDQAVSKLVEG